MVKQKPEEKARQHIDKLLEGAGWTIQDYPEFNLGTSLGVAVCEFPLDSGFTDYLLFLERSAGGVLEAKPEGTTLSGVSEQTAKYLTGIPGGLPKVQEQQERAGVKFTQAQTEWLVMIKDHIATSLTIGNEDFELSPFYEKGGVVKAYQFLGNVLNNILEELNEVLAV